MFESVFRDKCLIGDDASAATVEAVSVHVAAAMIASQLVLNKCKLVLSCHTQPGCIFV